MVALTSLDGLHQLDCLPEGLLDAAPTDLHRLLEGPTLIHLPGRVEQPLFVSVLLHGNETTGFVAVQALLNKYADRTLPRSLSLFIGNVAASRAGLRRLANQVDYNRIWPGTAYAHCPETRIARQIVDQMAAREVFASVDVHNNTGLNPHYACVNLLDLRTLRLAAMFGRLCIYSTRPRGTQSAAFSALCPAVTVECGKPHQEFGIEHALEYLEACLHLTEWPNHPLAAGDLELYDSVAQVFVDTCIDFDFGGSDAQLNLLRDIDHLNFTPVPAGFVLGYTRSRQPPLRVIDDGGREVAADYFVVEEGRLLVRRPVMPSMLTLDKLVIRQDCLGYLMERRALPG